MQMKNHKNSRSDGRNRPAFFFTLVSWLSVICVITPNLLSAQIPPEKDGMRSSDDKPPIIAPEGVNQTQPPAEEDEISLVIKGKIISVTEKEIIYKENGSLVESRMPLQNLHFLRRANGEYRFFTPAKTELKEPTKVVTEEIKPKEIAVVEKRISFDFFLIGGGVLHLAQNSDSEEYMNGLSGFVANSKNQNNNPKGFTGQLISGAAKIQYQGFIEPRLAYKQFMVGLNIGYAGFPKIAATVTSPNYSNTLNLSLDGLFIPALAIFYYRRPLTANLSLNLGLGGGVMYTSVKYIEDDNLTSNSQRYTAWSAVAVAKPEISYKMDRVVFMLSTPFYFAESRKVESGSTSLVNGDNGKVISPNLSGIAISIAVGYQIL